MPADERAKAMGTTAPRVGAGQPDADARKLLAQARRPQLRAFKFDVLRIEAGVIAEITTFGAGLFPVFGLPPMQ
jgi:hypothetical protein